MPFSVLSGKPWRSYLENMATDDKNINKQVRLFYTPNKVSLKHLEKKKILGHFSQNLLRFTPSQNCCLIILGSKDSTFLLATVSCWVDCGYTCLKTLMIKVFGFYISSLG